MVIQSSGTPILKPSSNFNIQAAWIKEPATNSGLSFLPYVLWFVRSTLPLCACVACLAPIRRRIYQEQSQIILYTITQSVVGQQVKGVLCVVKLDSFSHLVKTCLIAIVFPLLHLYFSNPVQQKFLTPIRFRSASKINNTSHCSSVVLSPHPISMCWVSD